jgi:hypothetical protein
MKKLPKWAEWNTVLEGVDQMQPVIDALKAELLAGQKAKRAGKPKRVSYHMRRIVNILFNVDAYFWHPMFEWAQAEEFRIRYKHMKTPLQKAVERAAKKNG